MSSVTSSQLHPILEDFICQFQKAFPQGGGVENSEAVTIQEKNFSLYGGYYVCNSTVKLDIEEQIFLAGPKNEEGEATAGRSLLAGRVVELKASHLSFIGTKENPIQIVGIDGVSIQATVSGKVKNLEIYLLKEAPFFYSTKDFSEFENVRLIRMESNGEDLSLTTVAIWKTYFDYLAYCDKEAEKKNRELFEM